MAIFSDTPGSKGVMPTNGASWQSPYPDSAGASLPQANGGGQLGTGPLDWKQKLGLVLSAAGDAANNARGIRSDGFGNAIATLQQANQRRALAATPYAGTPGAYVAKLQSLGVPLDAAMRAAAGFRELQGVKTLTPDQIAAKGYRAGTVVQEQPSGAESVVQQSDAKSPAAVQQAFEIARGMPVTQAQAGKLDILRERYRLPAGRVPLNASGANAPSQSAPYVPTLTSPDDALALPSGSYFYTPDGQLKQVP
jgi:hypothetical protein